MKNEDLYIHHIARNLRGIAELLKKEEVLAKLGTHVPFMTPSFDPEAMAAQVEACAEPFVPLTQEEKDAVVETIADMESDSKVYDRVENIISDWTEADWRYEHDVNAEMDAEDDDD